MNPDLQAQIENRIMRHTTYMGVPAWKQPMDAWTYQEIIWWTKPDTIIEIGNNAGGSLLYLADTMLRAGVRPRVVGVDIDHGRISPEVRWQPGIELVTGDALDVYEQVKELLTGGVMVIEDSAHTEDHTLAVMRAYGNLVTPGCYLVVEDGVMPPVAKAIERFLAETDRFEADPDREWPVTWNPNGYLRRTR